MVYGNKLNFLWTLCFYLVASQSSPSVPSIEDKSFIEDCVTAHNEMRRTVQPSAANMKYMTWDEGLAKTAKSWANQCKFEHNNCPANRCHPTFAYVGENIWLGGLYQFKPAIAIRSWYNESIFYTYSSQRCTKVCGHYTQVAWADSYKLGCAITICPNFGNNDPAIFVCNYGPAGNYVGARPYTEGASCSTCGKEDTCENNLCRNEIRERLMEYPNWNPKGQAPQSAACFYLVASQSSPSVPSIEDKSFIEDCVTAHNEMRRTVQPSAANMKYMTWDEGLAKTAKSWANQCKFEHNNCPANRCHPTFTYVGENIWLGGLYHFKPAIAIRSWYNERQFYTYSSQHCTKVCGHYTQVAWADSYKVGCAMTICPKLGKGDPVMFVCNYGPAGNYVGARPYTEGASCSTCGKEDTCENSLCRNETRERLTEYPNWNPKGQAPQSAASFYLVASRSPSVPSIEDKSFIEDCVTAHNEMRRTVQPSAANMKYMSWDEGLAKTAKARANKCKNQSNTCSEKPYQCHPTFKYVGENIWLGGSYQFKPESAIGLWYNEKMIYNYSTLHCSEVCGHYTQVVWADSYKVGCAMTICPYLQGASTAIFVCDYGPLGNYVGARPYTEGASCSTCGKEDTCENSLCKNEEREKLIEYPNWNPQGKAPQWTACNILYIVCILLRMF